MHLAKATATCANVLARTALFGASLLASSEAAAADEPAGQRGFDRFDYISRTFAEWKVVIGGGGRIAPKFEGAKDVELSPIPFFSARIGDRVSLDPRGVMVDAVQIEAFTLAVRGGYELGRDEDDDRHLRGLGDVDASGVIGATASYQFGVLKITASLDKTIGGSEGLLGTFGAEALGSLGPFILTVGTSATWADDNHMEAYFGVTGRQSARSGLSRYDAEAGIKRIDLYASATYLVDERWLVRGQAGFGYLVGDVADSPVVEDRAQPSGMLLVGYRF